VLLGIGVLFAWRTRRRQLRPYVLADDERRAPTLAGVTRTDRTS